MKNLLQSCFSLRTPAMIIYFLIMFVGEGYAQHIRYVDASKAPGASQNGTNWAKAYPTLKEALDVANSDPSIEEIHVAMGTYYPTGGQSGSDRDMAFGFYRGNLKVLGGFPTGGGIRDIKSNPTILSGEINTAATTDNSRHVVVIAGLDADQGHLRIDGFTIQWGRATGNNSLAYNNQSIPRESGGGIAIVNNYNSNRIGIFNCIISGNWAENTGAGFYIRNSFPIVASCLISGNYADYGGGIFNYDKATPWIFNCTIAGNNSNNSGGGGIRNSGSETVPRIINTIIYGNRGGGIVNNDGASFVAGFSLVEGRSELGTENLPFNTDPQFVNLVVPTTANTDGDYHLLATSPCIDFGSSSFVQELVQTDLDNNPRIVCNVDAGAYELPKFTRILTHPTRVVFCKTGINSFSITATLATQYQWEVKDNGGAFIAIAESPDYSGIHSPTLIVNNATLSMKGYEYRCVVKDGCGFEDISNAAVLTMENAINITAQPQDITYCEIGGNVSFSITAEHAAKFQWEVKKGDAPFAPISPAEAYSGATLRTLVVNGATLNMNGYEYRCVATDLCGFVEISNAAVLKIEKSVEIVMQPNDLVFCKNLPSTFTITAEHAVEYQWEVKKGDAAFIPINPSDGYTGSITSTLELTNVTVEMGGYEYRCVVKDFCGFEDISNAAVLRIENLISINLQPQPSTDYSCRSETFKIEALNATDYRWQVDQGNGFSDIADGAMYAGASTPQLLVRSTTKEMSGYVFRCMVSNSCSPDVISHSATLTVQYFPIRYVKVGGTGTGTSWEDASGNIQQMINESCDGAEIWVAGGNYKPSVNIAGSSGNFNKAFVMAKNVKIYGGFAGTETILSERNLQLKSNKSVLDGDLDGNNQKSAQDAIHVVVAVGNLGTALIDGFTITNGNASGSVYSISLGGQIIYGSYGGGLYVTASSLTVRNVSFTNNYAVTYGGGIYNANSSVSVERCEFSGNSARDGGGIYNLQSNCYVNNSLFSGNFAASTGGGIHSYINCTTTLTNVTFSGNMASGPTYGGGIFNNTNSVLDLRNCILWGNSSDIGVYNSSQTVSYSLLSTGGYNVAYGNPQFVDAPSYEDAPFVGGDYHLQSCSPAINVGAPATTGGIDLDGQNRVLFSRVDLGAYESIRTFEQDEGHLASSATSKGMNYQSRTGRTSYTAGCNQLLASIKGEGSDPVSGIVNVTVRLNDPFQFVGRSYEIMSQANATEATGLVTLYFTQAEFDAYNLVNRMKLPTNSTDIQGISNLRILKKSGKSGDNSGLPASFLGESLQINPADEQIIWNGTQAHWEVSFNVVGFSGFFAYAMDEALPVNLVHFGAETLEDDVKLFWQTTSETGASHFELERSPDAKTWSNIDHIPADGERDGLKEYVAVDGSPLKEWNYYRLKMVDLDGHYSYSQIVSARLLKHTDPGLVLYPNPVKDGIVRMKNWDKGLFTLSVYNLLGQKADFKILSQNEEVITMDVSALATGVYLISLQQGSRVEVKTFVVHK
jgi:hypothetical protein